MNAEYEEIDLGKHLELPVGILQDGVVIRDVELLASNGVAEKVFLKKTGGKPYTWIANVLSVAIARIGSTKVGAAVRADYLKENAVTIPGIILRLPFADANTLLLEIHRRIWQNLIPNQTCMCKYCHKDFVMDIDLNRITMGEENLAVMAAIADGVEQLEADLVDGFEFVPFMRTGTNVMKHEEFAGRYNRVTFRVPTLGDAIQQEKHYGDEVTFWRRLAYATQKTVERVEDGEVVETLPTELKTQLSMRFYDSELSSKDLKIIRDTLREKLPTMPFVYEEDCPLCDRTTPVAVEAESFFSA